MTSFGRFLALLPFVFCTACSTITVQRDYDRNAVFSSYKTYAWAPPSKAQPPTDAEVESAIRNAVDKRLAADGFTKVEGSKPDFYAVYHVTTGVQTDVRHYTDWGFGTAYRAGVGYYTGWPGNPVTYAVLDQQKVGTLILDFVEARREQLVWRAVATSVLKPGEKNVRTAEEAVNSMLRTFPPSEPKKP